MPTVNRQVCLAARPSGLPEDSDWEHRERPVPQPGPGQFVVELSHLSLDPAMRGWMNAGASYIDPVEVGDVMRAGAVGRVSASEHPALPQEITYTGFLACRSMRSPTARA